MTPGLSRLMKTRNAAQAFYELTLWANRAPYSRSYRVERHGQRFIGGAGGRETYSVDYSVTIWDSTRPDLPVLDNGSGNGKPVTRPWSKSVCSNELHDAVNTILPWLRGEL